MDAARISMAQLRPLLFRIHSAGDREMPRREAGPVPSQRRGQMRERGDSGGLGGPVSVTQTTRLDEDGRRALAFIAGNADGYTRAVMLAHGISLALTASLIHAGLATDRMPKRRVGRGTVARVRTTDAGRQALGEHEPSPSPSLLFVQARGNLIRILEQALAAAEELGDGATAYLIERARDEVRAQQFRLSRA